MYGIRFFLVVQIFFLMFFYSWAKASENPIISLAGSNRFIQWNLQADVVNSITDQNILEAQGKVYLRRGDDYLKADFARYYNDSKWVYLQGNVEVKMGADTMRASQAEFDLENQIGWVADGEIFLSEPNAYFSGSRIVKHWGNVYSFEDATVTMCDPVDGSSPPWSITAQKAVIEVDGYARLTGSTFQIKDQAVFYTPYMVFSTKSSRQTGFLYPTFSHSKKKGFIYEQPFFWALNKHSDITLSTNLMTRHGLMPGFEFRSRPSENTQAWFRADWIYDRINNTNLGTGAYSRDPYVRENHNRYWLRGMFDSKLGASEWLFKSTVDYVSDQDYLREFSSGLGGYRKTREDLLDWFNRDLSLREKTRESGFLLKRDWERMSFNVSSLYRQDPSLGHGNKHRDQDTTVQELPRVDAYLFKGRVAPSLPLEVEAAAIGAYYNREKGTRGGRFTLSPRLTLPITGKYGSFINSVGLRQTYYTTSKEDDQVLSLPEHWYQGKARKQTGTSRTLPEFTSELSTEFAKVYPLHHKGLSAVMEDVGKSEWVGLKHSIRPIVRYDYRQFKDQRDNPFYDESDRLAPKSLVTYGITNVITRKKQSVVAHKNKEKELVTQINEHYLELVRFDLSQSYDTREASRTHLRNQYARKPYGDIKGELTIGVSDYLSLHAKDAYSPYRKEITSHESGVKISWPQTASLYVGYDFRKKIDEYQRLRRRDIEYISTRAGIQLFSNRLSVDLGYNYDYKNNKNHETNVALTYHHQCYAISAYATFEPNDTSYGLMIKLTGLGD